MFEGQVDSTKTTNVLFDVVKRNYHIMVNITGAMAKTFMSKACNISCTSDVTHICDKTGSDCMGRPPYAVSDNRIPCAKCSRRFRSQWFFANVKKIATKNPFGNESDAARLVSAQGKQ